MEKSIIVLIVHGISGLPHRIEYVSPAKQRHKQRGIDWRGIVHESYSQRSEIEKEVIAEALDQPRSGESTWLLPGERKGGKGF